MKKTLLLLSSLLALGSTAFANEFRPTGSIKQEIRWFGDKEEINSETLRFTLAEGGVRFTEKFYIDYRVRDFMRYHSDEGSNTKDVRTRLYYDHGFLRDSKTTSRQRLEVRSTANYNRFTYTPELNFSKYFEPGKYYSLDSIKIRPALRYQDDNNAGKAYTSAAVDFLTSSSFPAVPGYLGFDFNVYAGYLDDNYTKNGKNESGEAAAWIEFYLFYEYQLGSLHGVDFAAYYEFGLDPLKLFEDDRDSTQRSGTFDRTINIYQDFELQASYKVNDSTSIYGAIAVEHANQKNQQYVSDFKWQPYAYFGWRTKF